MRSFTFNPVLICLALLLWPPLVYAQIVNDGATNTLSNVTNIISGDVVVGTNGSFTLLILSDNAPAEPQRYYRLR